MPKAPLFFSATAEQTVKLGVAEITGEVQLKLHVVQGRPEVLTLGLSGDGDVIEVSGAKLRDWSVRQGSGASSDERFLDLHPALPTPTAPQANPTDYDLVVRTRLRKPTVPGTVKILIVTPGEAVGFASKVSLLSDAGIDFRVTATDGMVPIGDTSGARGVAQFFGVETAMGWYHNYSGYVVFGIAVCLVLATGSLLDRYCGGSLSQEAKCR